MSDHPDIPPDEMNEGLTGALLLSGLIERRLIEAPISIDGDAVTEALRDMGGTWLDRDEAIAAALGIIQESGGPDPDTAPVQWKALLHEQYDSLLVAVGRR